MVLSVSFRYTPRFWFYFCWFSSTLAIALGLGYFHTRFVYAIGIANSAHPMAGFWLERPVLYFGISMGGAVLLYLLSFLLPMFVFLRVFDRKGEITFYADHAVLCRGGKTIEMPYEEIRRIKIRAYRPSMWHAHKTPLLDFTIYHGSGRCHLTCSEREMRQSRGKQIYSLMQAMDELRSRRPVYAQAA